MESQRRNRNHGGHGGHGGKSAGWGRGFGVGGWGEEELLAGEEESKTARGQENGNVFHRMYRMNKMRRRPKQPFEGLLFHPAWPFCVQWRACKRNSLRY